MCRRRRHVAGCGYGLCHDDVSAAESLGVLVGMDQTEEMLGRIFSRFCVGK